MKKIPYTKAAWITSACLLILLAVLGTGATIAWFTYVPPVDCNTFQVGTMDLKVSYKNDQVTEYTTMDANTAVFHDQALYEPGYTQVVYLKIENDGNVSFDYKLSVVMNSYTDSINMDGEILHLPDHLRFGVIFGASEAELDRELAREYAENPMESYCLDSYSPQDTVSVAPGEIRYAALVVFMPEEVNNVANGRGEIASVELGVGVYAQQAGTPMD